MYLSIKIFDFLGKKNGSGARNQETKKQPDPLWNKEF
jgi:hypothetical protein